MGIKGMSSYNSRRVSEPRVALSTHSVERVPASPNRCLEEAGVTAPAAANLLNTKFKIKGFSKGEISLTCGIVRSWDQRLFWAPSTVENVQQSNLSIERNQKTGARKGCVGQKYLRDWRTTVSLKLHGWAADSEAKTKVLFDIRKLCVCVCVAFTPAEIK